MKKLLTLIGAAAVSFGLCAESLNGYNFDDDEPGAFNFVADENPPAGEFFWFATGMNFEDISGTVTAYKTAPAEDNLNYLALETGSDPVFRTVTALSTESNVTNAQQVSMTGGIVFDQRVKFSAFDSDPTELDANAKIAVWLKADEENGITNLYVSTAVCDALFDVTQTNVVLQGANVEPDSWHQLTITAIPAWNFGSGNIVPGFVVAIDGVPLASADALFPSEDSNGFKPTPGAAKLIAEKKLFPSRISDTTTNGRTLMGVGYQGSGAIDSIDVADGNAFEATATITAPANATISSVVSTNGYAIIDNGNGTYTVANGDGIRVELAPAPGYHFTGGSSQEFGVDGNTEIGANAFTDITVERDATYVAEIVGGGKYESLAGAVAAAGADATVRLLGDYSMASTLVVPAEKSITLDLGGYTLTSTVDPVVENHGTLTVFGGAIAGSGAVDIFDNYGTLSVTNGTYTTGGWGIVNFANANATVDNGTFTSVENCVLAFRNNSTITINGGTFTSTDNAVIADHGTAGRKGNVITINGGTFNGSVTTVGYAACGIYVANDDTVIVNGGTFNIAGGCGILARAGQVTVNDVEINTTGTSIGKVGDSRVVVPCSAIVYDTDAAYPGYDAETTGLAVEDGDFSSDVACVTQINNNGGDIAVAVSGGTFDQPIDGEYCADGYVPVDDGAGHYGVDFGYTITYVSAHGTAPMAKDVKVASLGGEYTLLDEDLPALEATGYTFNGWGKTAGEKINTNTTLTASWTAVEYTLTYESAQGTAPAAVTYTIESDDFAFAAAPTADGYTFLGWVIGTTTNAAASTFVVADHLENTTATAAWKENAPVGPTVDGKTVDPLEVFDTATSTKPITYTTAPTLSGEEGSQKITWGGKTVDVPTYYTASLEGTTVSLSLNENAIPEIGATAAGADQEAVPAMEVGSTTVSVGITSTNEKLWYGLSSSSTVGGEYTAPASVTKGTGKAMSLSIVKGADAAKFYKVYVTDVAPKSETP